MKSIRRQLSRNVVLVAATFLGASTAVAAIVTIAALRRSFNEGLHDRAEAICALSEKEKNGNYSFDFSPEFLAQYNAGTGVYFEIWDASGKVLTRSPSLATGELPRFALKDANLFYRRCPLPSGRGRALGIRYFPEGTNIAVPTDALFLEIAADAELLHRQVAWITWGAVGSAAAFSFGILLLVPRVISRGLESIEKLSGEVEGVHSHALTGTFSKIEMPIELQPISAALDRLMARLSESFARERAFGSDLAHELRTPLTELKTLVETAVKWPKTRDENHDQQVLEIIAQMESLVSRLLFLARLDAGQKPSAIETIAFPETIAATISKFEPDIVARGLRVKSEVQPIHILADQLLFNIVITNLLRNAVEYSLPGTEITVVGRRGDDAYRLSVGNECDLDAGDLSRLFERFWRKSKSRTDLAMHSGLGLSLVRSAVGVLGWSIQTELRGGEVVFLVTIPIAPDRSTIIT